jgi:putative FmdB family regulatory protein
MPIYEYRCGECGQEHEVLQKVSEPPLTECPACGKPALKKQLSAAGFQLKGSGWYATDFKGSAKKPEKTAETKTEAKTEVKTETKSETKTESKPASTSTTTD